MPLSPADRARINLYLDRLDSLEVKRVVASESAFRQWFSVTLPDIFQKVKERMSQLWSWLKAVFS